MSAERERLVKAVEKSELNFARAKRNDWWLGVYLDERDDARRALAAYDAAHKEEKL